MISTQRDTQKLELGGMGSLMEKLQHPENSACLLYTVEHTGDAIAYR